ncbi:MAG TPA: hypothetical protein VK106_04530 [Balneolaceae bacterium]|nr:hypothetical protein [Balneolaceae bacterium]
MSVKNVGSSSLLLLLSSCSPPAFAGARQEEARTGPIADNTLSA